MLDLVCHRERRALERAASLSAAAVPSVDQAQFVSTCVKLVLQGLQVSSADATERRGAGVGDGSVERRASIRLRLQSHEALGARASAGGSRHAHVVPGKAPGMLLLVVCVDHLKIPVNPFAAKRVLADLGLQTPKAPKEARCAPDCSSSAAAAGVSAHAPASGAGERGVAGRQDAGARTKAGDHKSNATWTSPQAKTAESKGKDLGEGAGKGVKLIQALGRVHVLVQVRASELVVTNMQQTHGLPLSLALDSLSVHNHTDNPPFGLSISSAPASLGEASRAGGAAGAGVAARADQMVEEKVLQELEALEQKFSFGPLATLQAVDRDPGAVGDAAQGFQASMVLKTLQQQLREHAMQMQRARARISAAFRPPPASISSAEEHAAASVRGAGDLFKVADSFGRTRATLENILVQVLGPDRDGPAGQVLLAAVKGAGMAQGRVAGDPQSMGANAARWCDGVAPEPIDAEEMIEIFEAFCEEEEEEYAIALHGR